MLDQMTEDQRKFLEKARLLEQFFRDKAKEMLNSVPGQKLEFEMSVASIVDQLEQKRKEVGDEHHIKVVERLYAEAKVMDKLQFATVSSILLLADGMFEEAMNEIDTLVQADRGPVQ